LAMADIKGLLIFIVEKVRLAFDLDQVDRVVRACTLKPLPGSPDTVLGMLNLNGIPVPVVSLRKKLGFDEREMDTTDEIIIVKREEALIGVLVDEVEDVTHTKEITKLPSAAELTHLRGALHIHGDIVLIHDIDRFFSQSEELALAKAFIRGTADK
jgi:purine-binding chemotaxis protein CheW